MEFSTSSVPFSLGSFMGEDSTMQSIFVGASEALVKFYATRQGLFATASKTFLPDKVKPEVTKALVPDADGIYRLSVTWRKLIASAKAEVETAANALANRKQPSDAVAVDDMRRIRDYFLALGKTAQLIWLRAQIDAGDKTALTAVLTLPRSLNVMTPELRKAVERTVAGDAYDLLEKAEQEAAGDFPARPRATPRARQILMYGRLSANR